MRSISVVLLVVLLSACSQGIVPTNDEALGSAAMMEKQIVAGGVVANAPNAQFGRSVALEGDRMVVTCECVGRAAVAYILERTGAGVWRNVKTLRTPKPTYTYMEPQATLSGDTVVISSAETGIVSVFEQNQGGLNNWGLVKELRGSRLYYDGFGEGISLDNNTLVVGAFMSNVGTTEYQGSAYVFQRHRGGINNWGQVAQLSASDGQSWDSFGSSVAVSGDTVVVGAYTDDSGSNFSQGSAYLFERDEGGVNQWGQTQKLLASAPLPYDFFGADVAIDSDTLVVGAYFSYSNDGEGFAFVFERGATQWSRVKKLIASDAARGDYFGSAVAIDEDTILVGAVYDAVGANPGQGSAYMFRRNRGGEDNWGQLRKLTASDGASVDYYGSALAVSGTTIVIAAPLNDVEENTDKGTVYTYE